MSDKNFMALIAIIIVAVVGSIIVFGGNSESNGAFIGNPLEIATGVANEDGEAQLADHLRGPEDARVTIIEFADFACPACAAFHPELLQLEAAYPDDVNVVFRHNPLTQIHPNAFAAHRASVAAGNQGMFWEMHDLLYERQNSWSAQVAGLDISAASQVFKSYAEQLGLDLEQFEADVESQATFDYIDSHLDSGAQLDVTGTPTLYINGELVTERSFQEMSAIVDSILASDGAADTEDATETTEDDSEATDDEVVELQTTAPEEN